MLRRLLVSSIIGTLIATPAMANGLRYNSTPYDNLRDFNRTAGYAGLYLNVPLQPGARLDKRRLSYGFAAGLRSTASNVHNRPWQTLGLERQQDIRINALNFNLSERGFETLNLGGAAVLAGQDNLTIWQLAANGDDEYGGSGGFPLYGIVAIGAVAAIAVVGLGKGNGPLPQEEESSS